MAKSTSNSAKRIFGRKSLKTIYALSILSFVTQDFKKKKKNTFDIVLFQGRQLYILDFVCFFYNQPCECCIVSHYGKMKKIIQLICINSYSEEVVVGHVAKNMSKITYMFLYLPHWALDIFVTEKRINCRGGCELEIPANFYFYGPGKAINWLKNKIDKIEEKLVKHRLK